jgi:DNA mismatch endonuclease Vsr
VPNDLYPKDFIIDLPKPPGYFGAEEFFGRMDSAVGGAVGGVDVIREPDVVLPKYRTAILIHGCFWHRHSGCRYAYMPKSRQEFWLNKFGANVRRDRKVKQELTELGWRVLTVW